MSKPLLLIFNPMGNFPHQAPRPIQLHYNAESVDAIIRTMQHAGSLSQIDTRGVTCVNLQPDYVIDLKEISDKWTFVLKVDNERGSRNSMFSSLGGQQERIDVPMSLSQSSSLYTGYFTDEPYHHNAGNLLPNPISRMVFLHKTVFGHSNAGGEVTSPITDTHCVDANTIINATRQSYGGSLFVNSPDQIIVGIDLSGNRGLEVGPTNVITRGSGTQLMGTANLSGQHVAGTINKAIVQAATQLEASDFAGMQNAMQSSYFNNVVGDGMTDEFVTSAQAAATDLSARRGSYGLDPTMPISVNDVSLYYGDIDVEFQRLNPHTVFGNAEDQAQANAAVAWARYTFDSIVPFIGKLGIADIDIEAHSGMRNWIDQSYDVFNVSVTTIQPHDNVQKKAALLKYFFEKYVLDVIPMNGIGNVYIRMNGSIFTKVTVSLTLCDHNNKSTIIEIPTLLGGLVSTTLANDQTYGNNTAEVGQVINHAINAL